MYRQLIIPHLDRTSVQWNKCYSQAPRRWSPKTEDKHDHAPSARKFNVPNRKHHYSLLPPTKYVMHDRLMNDM